MSYLLSILKKLDVNAYKHKDNFYKLKYKGVNISLEFKFLSRRCNYFTIYISDTSVLHTTGFKFRLKSEEVCESRIIEILDIIVILETHNIHKLVNPIEQSLSELIRKLRSIDLSTDCGRYSGYLTRTISIKCGSGCCISKLQWESKLVNNHWLIIQFCLLLNPDFKDISICLKINTFGIESNKQHIVYKFSPISISGRYSDSIDIDNWISSEFGNLVLDAMISSRNLAVKVLLSKVLNAL